MTLSLAAVFIPLMFMGGIIGRLFHEFAVTIMVAILISGFVSLTLTPMLCSRLLKSHKGETHGRLYNFTEGAVQRDAARVRAQPRVGDAAPAADARVFAADPRADGGALADHPEGTLSAR